MEKVFNVKVSTCAEFNKSSGFIKSLPAAESFFLQDVKTKKSNKKVAESLKTFRHEFFSEQLLLYEY
jgi:hypothetical protein